MIDVKELRILNWVNMDGEPYNIRAGEQIDDYSDRMKPIKLTPEILLACGFEGFLTNNELTLELYNDGESDSCYITCFDKKAEEIRLFLDIHQRNDQWIPQHICRDLSAVKSLHQLQNIYHALTGKELEYNPEIKNRPAISSRK